MTSCSLPRLIVNIPTSHRHRCAWLGYACALSVVLFGCTETREPGSTVSVAEEPSPAYRNIDTPTEYVGDEACTRCHAEAAAAYRPHAMARSFHAWTRETRVEPPLDSAIHHASSGLSYRVVEVDGHLYQEEFVAGPEGRRLHELRRRMDFVMGSGNVARTYFTEENGRLFQLPLTWYRDGGWDFSPGYTVNNARFGRLMPNRCLACHGSYPRALSFLEGKYAELPPGIGCERCHGPGALHVEERSAGAPADSTFDDTIVNPRHLPFERRLDVCQQCHVHTPVTVLREGRDAFSYLPSQPLRDHAAFFRVAGEIDIVSHADRLRQSSCFLQSRATERPLECATCHNPHQPTRDREAQNEPCRTCHAASSLERQLAAAASQASHAGTADCVGCHMPRVQERTIPHGSFTDHWIRTVGGSSEPARTSRRSSRSVEPYFARDRRGPEAAIYRAAGEIVHATLAPNTRLLDDGASALQRALGSDTTRGDAHFLLGVAYQQLGRAEEAIGPLERTLRIDPDRPEALRALAQAYEAVGRPVTDSLYRRALELQPALAWIRAEYADFLQTQGRSTAAEQAYREALAERPSLDVAAFNLGTLLTEQGRLDEAAEFFREAVRLNPSLAEALAPLFYIRTAGNQVTGARTLGSPLTTLPVRYRGPNAVQVTMARGSLRFVNVPAGAAVRIRKPNGVLVRGVPPVEATTVAWDFLNEAGTLIASGAYQADVQARNESGRPLVPQRFFFGIVRVRVE